MDTYYHPHDLSKFADMGKGNTALWDKFLSYYSAVFAAGALTEREKALIALAIIAAAAALEAMQHFLPHRHATIHDFFVKAEGTGCGVIAAAFLHKALATGCRCRER